MKNHAFVEWQGYAHREVKWVPKQRKPHWDYFKLATVPTKGSRWWLNQKHPMWKSKDEDPRTVCTICSQKCDHPIHM